ncbi:hypothetical protein AB0N31_17840 [Streptomyces sp. NPDC051051]|uniref:hypothetical protein n=1 Tax=Streptomyces sp. NPDC051051 TaxID=3155666 RepID=UPI003442A7AD
MFRGAAGVPAGPMSDAAITLTDPGEEDSVLLRCRVANVRSLRDEQELSWVRAG